MLQGHFISMSFEDYTEMTAALRENRDSGSFLFNIWCELRGFTAPLFFAITGLVFTYLLTKNPCGPFWKQKRVQKGIKRGISIMLWGYFLQLNIKHIELYMTGEINSRFYAFHVLQCIGLGILTLIFIYWIHTKIKRIPIEVSLLICGTLAIVLKPLIHSNGLPFFPSGAHEIIQNAFHGPNSVFPIFSSFGFILFGGAMGAFLNRFNHKIAESRFIIKMASIGILICLAAHAIIFMIGSMYPQNPYLGKGYWNFDQLAWIIGVISSLMYIEQKTPFKIPFLIPIGQNTLVVYIIHVVLLYGAITGLGLKTYISKSLTFGESIFGAVLFIIFFVILTKLQPAIIKGVKHILRN
ncbi:MAG: hypothetical protein ACJAUJ_001593 [Salibacteraceae bacterium]|jgi:hypothetical protein